MVTSHARITPEETHEAEDKEDISLTPLAMPLMSGPGAIGVVMALAAHVDTEMSYLGMVIGIAAIALSVSLFFLLGGPLVKRLGPSAVGAINKIFGFLILAIAVQLVWNGMVDFK
jgi:multiple antibiotic resistance protein